MRKQLATLSAVGLLATAGLIGAVPADAAETATFSTLTVSGDTAKPNDVLTLTANWQMPDHTAPGDTGFLPLPPELIPANGINDFPLNNAAGETVATAHYDAARGGIVITATDLVASKPLNIRGTIFFAAQVKADATPGEKIIIRWGGVEKAVTVQQGWNGKGNAVTIPWKGAYQTGTRDIGWQRDSVGPYDSAHITDTPHNATIKCDSLRLLKGDQRDGSYPEDAQGDWKLDRLQNLHCGPDGFSADLPTLPKGYLHHLTYLTTPNAGAAEITNEWTLVSSLGTTGGTSASKVYTAGGTGDGENEPVTPPVTEEPTPEPSTPAEPTEEPAPEPSTPTEEPTTPPATDEPTPEPTKSEEPSPEPSKSEEPTPEPTKSEEPTPCPTSAAPSAEPSTEPTTSDSPSNSTGTPPSGGSPTTTPSTPPEGTRPTSGPSSEPSAPTRESNVPGADRNPSTEPSAKSSPSTSETPSSESSSTHPGGSKSESQRSSSGSGHQSDQGTPSTATSSSTEKSATPPHNDDDHPGAASEALAYTGANWVWMLPVAAALILGGVAVLTVLGAAKRRRNDS